MGNEASKTQGHNSNLTKRINPVPLKSVRKLLSFQLIVLRVFEAPIKVYSKKEIN